ncbi:MAG: Crp/Fnr family transcriptional regulator [Flavobacteriales bacterium]
MDPINALKAYYQQLNPFMTEEDWHFFQSVQRVRRVKKGEMIIKPGEVCNHVSFVAEGLVRYFYFNEGKEITADFCPENCYTSEYCSFLTRRPTMDYLEALEDSVLVEMDYEGMQSLYSRGALFERMGRLIAEGLFISLSTRNSTLMTKSPEDRYNEFFESHPQMFQRVPLYMIASYLGITPETLSRIRKRLTEKAKQNS